MPEREAHDPPLALGEDVVVRQGQEVVPALLVPVRDHLRVVVPVAPEGVGVQVALPPTGFRLCGGDTGIHDAGRAADTKEQEHGAAAEEEVTGGGFHSGEWSG